MFRRPTAGETEEDLLRYQEEFLARKAHSAVTVVKKADKRKPAAESEEASKRDVVSLGGGELCSLSQHKPNFC